MNQTNSKKITVLDEQQAFYFHNSVGNYTGHKANSLKEFEQELCKVDYKSLEFHLFREDFEKWLRFSLKEEILANKVEALRKQNIKGKLLRNWLYTYVKHQNKPVKNSVKVYTTSKVVHKNRNMGKNSQV